MIDKKINSQKAASLSSGVSSLSSSSSSSSSSTRSSPAKDSSANHTANSSSANFSSANSSANFSSANSSANVSANPSPPLIKNQHKISVTPTQDSIRKAFEAQLLAGKSRLKKVDDEVGQVAKPPPAPVPPPPPPLPTQEALRNGGSNSMRLRSYQIPQAPKLKKTPPSLASKKGLVAPNGLSAREELMNAIRGTGGFHGLRKVKDLGFFLTGL